MWLNSCINFSVNVPATKSDANLLGQVNSLALGGSDLHKRLTVRVGKAALDNISLALNLTLADFQITEVDRVRVRQGRGCLGLVIKTAELHRGQL
jgi:hypothetical protein